MKILYIHKAFYDKRPPVISTVERLIKLNHTVQLLTAGINHETKLSLEKRGVVVHDFGVMPVARTRKILYYVSYRFKARKIIKKLHTTNLIWIGSVDAAVAIGSFLFKFPYVLQIQELYDKNNFFRKTLKKLMVNSKVNVVPENARALIFRSWYKLERTPHVLPNKPLLISHDKNQQITHPENALKFEKIKNKKLILYQAVMIRMDTSDIAQALLELGDDYVLGLLGGVRDKILIKYMLKKFPNVVHFEHMYAPFHLTLTSNAFIGVLTYNYESLNNVFCAPNKTWEFAGFGIPMLANNLPVLKLHLEKYKAGESYEFNDVGTIKEAILKISNNYEEYCNGAKKLYQSVNMENTISDILNKMGSNHED